VLVAVEQYQQTTILGVPFAISDAGAMRDTLIEQMHVPAKNIKLWTNHHATRSSLEHDLRYEISTLGPEDRFIFFHAGHGFYASGGNRLTAWDTRTVNLEETTVSIDEILLSLLKKSPCRQSLIFIDACASTFGEANARNILQELKLEEFADFVKSTAYCAAFFSCAPGQQSYSSEKVKHGIWTYHLLKAFRGEDESVFERDRRITGQSLQNYLALRVPEFIAKRTALNAIQRPYAELAANGAFEITRIPEGTAPKPKPKDSPLPSQAPDEERIIIANQAYKHQRDHAPITDLMTKIWELPRWSLWVRPLKFKKARFKSLEHCEQFLASQHVSIQGGRWSRYPWFRGAPEYGAECICGETDVEDPPVQHTERWLLFQSGQFVHIMALDRVEPLGKRIHVFEILEVITGIYELAARMAEQNIITDDVGIRIELQGVAGRQLAWYEEHDLSAWSQEDTITLESTHTAAELQGRRRELSLDSAINIYGHFGWNKPPKNEIEAEQQRRFGPPPSSKVPPTKARPTTSAVGNASIKVHESLPLFDMSCTNLTFSWDQQMAVRIEWTENDKAKGYTSTFVNNSASDVEKYSIEVAEAKPWSTTHAAFLPHNAFKRRYIYRGTTIGPMDDGSREWLIRNYQSPGTGLRLAIGNDDQSLLMYPKNEVSSFQVWRLTIVPIFTPARGEQIPLSHVHLYVRWDPEHESFQMAKDPAE
jgi:hypothetical protein